MELSIVDIAPVRAGSTATDAYEDTIELAQTAERLGYSRFWVAEHHGLADSIASTTPEVLISRLAAETDEIRVGSGTVLLNHYAPFKVAETFASLDALAPGRIDLGLGRATGMPAADRALRSGGPRRAGDDHAEKIEETARHLYDAFPDSHPYGDIEIPRSPDGTPEVWVLGSSPASAEIAGDLGLPYAFAAFIRPTAAADAMATYREHFEESEFDAGLDDPHSALAVNAACAETDREAARLRASSEAAYRRMQRGAFGPPPSVDEAVDELGGVPDPTPESLPPGEWPRAISGSPDTLATLLDEMTDAVGADEVIVQNLIEDPDDRIRSHELLAEGVGLSPR
ncbi:MULTISPECIES: LLM class flavin-dependent oxidoreductase [Halorussus]|uniref:LLM class flavin-dependent oxidoreductase n=1 Tax=Halorussus TaxID=1070314 RepID=UPI000E218211|nr:MULTISPECIES: LLM class flavin-dependent oxidoreductase [Halorussus]NHN58942.1 LLM class flavin-dependent oxidoreductase [Halorussus sp. JP-T4]